MEFYLINLQMFCTNEIFSFITIKPLFIIISDMIALQQETEKQTIYTL